jgi:hypothetical protein
MGLRNPRKHEVRVGFVVEPEPIKPPKNLVHTLRKNGIKVGIKHYRWAWPEEGEGNEGWSLQHFTNDSTSKMFWIIAPCGGKTVVTVTLQDGRTATGEAVCSNKETYNRKVGVYVALQRALKAARALPKNHVSP